MKKEEVKTKVKNLKLPIILGLIVVIIGLVLVNLKNDEEKADVWQPSETQLAEVTPEKDRIYREISIGEKKLQVEVVDTVEKITTGLSYRSEIGSDGMLFVMPTKSVPSFWMKGMRFAIDIVWIDCGQQNLKSEISHQQLRSSGGQANLKNSECKIVDVSENVPVEANPDKPVNFYSPKAPVTHVLEVENENDYGLAVGDVVNIYHEDSGK